ncbi:iron-sulfur cluster repair di-iron protein [Halobacillus andaensis]|uniref:Iron-sulfur cluster repair di-iron protein n=1 Tax=Halobacillus andaensis TaxID=1176239 RepID=A0A917EZ19_HALAA|nr:iron-sulfur cluster repair di-iron protein [Halobacillus andaensis]MBP2005638.1 regulator of cell morphogenesis and NO signaling [Halobacillus andaensis]GGF27147.1 iron-sulfur cluster repair di-iron protein [Halobacillus andaensis]
MVQTFDEQCIVSDIVKQFPKSSDLFKSYRIDFCCGGNRPLREAIEKRNLPKEEVLQRLNKLYEENEALNQKQINWDTASSSELIDHIIQKHHHYLQEELPNLSPFVTKVMKVHGGKQPHLRVIHKLFNELKTELEQHTLKEENEDFPLIIEYETNPTEEQLQIIQTKLADLEDEHSHAGDVLKELREITNDYSPPEGACGTYRLVYNRLEELEAETFQHIHLENNILFPRYMS